MFAFLSVGAWERGYGYALTLVTEEVFDTDEFPIYGINM